MALRFALNYCPFFKIPVRWDVPIGAFRCFFIGFSAIWWTPSLGMLGPLGRRFLALTFALNCCPFLKLWVSARQDFDSGGDFKGKVGAEDDVVGKVQKDELSRILKCFNSLSEIEDLRVLGCLLGWLG